MQTKTIECGYFELSEDKTFHYAGYECAAWWTDTHVKAGRYPVFASINQDGHVEEFVCTLPGVIEGDSFQSLFCGNRVGKPYDTLQNAGKPSSYTLRMASYCLHNSPAWHVDLSVLPNIGLCLHCARRLFPEVRGARWFRVYKDGRVYSDGRFVGRVSAASAPEVK